jgi:hypothetical protein
MNNVSNDVKPVNRELLNKLAAFIYGRIESMAGKCCAGCDNLCNEDCSNQVSEYVRVHESIFDAETAVKEFKDYDRREVTSCLDLLEEFDVETIKNFSVRK